MADQTFDRSRRETERRGAAPRVFLVVALTLGADRGTSGGNPSAEVARIVDAKTLNCICGQSGRLIMTKSFYWIAEIAACVLFVAALCPSSAIAQSEVRIETEILTELPSSAGVADLNNRGVIVGSAPSETGESQVPFRWTQQAGVELLIGDVQGAATAVNDAGAVIGWYIVGGNLFGFLWTPVLKFVDLGTFMPSAINNRGQIVGECDFLPGTWSPPCLWEHGNLTTLGTGWVPGDLNERGEVTGQALVDNQFVAITWSRQTGVTVLPHSGAPAVDGGFSLKIAVTLWGSMHQTQSQAIRLGGIGAVHWRRFHCLEVRSSRSMRADGQSAVMK
jgi:hypothetical protein